MLKKMLTASIITLCFTAHAQAINSLGEQMLTPIPHSTVILEKTRAINSNQNSNKNNHQDNKNSKNNNFSYYAPISSQYKVVTAYIKDTEVKQFVNNHNAIFAVSWNGPTKPNLKQLLGKYHDHTEHNKHIFTNQEMSQQDFIISSIERKELFHGSASIPSLTPNGFSFKP